MFWVSDLLVVCTLLEVLTDPQTVLQCVPMRILSSSFGQKLLIYFENIITWTTITTAPPPCTSVRVCLWSFVRISCLVLISTSMRHLFFAVSKKIRTPQKISTIRNLLFLLLLTAIIISPFSNLGVNSKIHIVQFMSHLILPRLRTDCSGHFN